MKERMIIDGYNVLHSRAFIAPAHLDLEGQREHLIRLLKSYAAKTGTHITVVFDNSQKPSSTIRQNKRLKLVYSLPGKEADDIIRQMIRSEKTPSSVLVVSSDRMIRFSAKDHGISNLSSEEFCGIMRSANSAKKAGKVKFSEEQFQSSKKYGANISDSEVQFWKSLFEQGDSDE